jgi:hypothetical protein
VVDRAVLNLNAIKGARKEIYGAVGPLEDIGGEADFLINSLALVKATPNLQTTGVGQQAYEVMVLTARLAVSMMIIGAENRRNSEPQELRPDDYEYNHLETMLGQLGNARAALADLISAVNVGLRGNARDGFQVSLRSLLSVNKKVRGVLGVNLILFDRLGHRIREQSGKSLVPPWS